MPRGRPQASCANMCMVHGCACGTNMCMVGLPSAWAMARRRLDYSGELDPANPLLHVPHTSDLT